MAFPDHFGQNPSFNTGNLKIALANGANLDERGLLFIILNRHLTNFKARQLADRLLQKFKHLADVIKANLAELLSVEGISTSIALELIQLRQIMSALLKADIYRRPVIDGYGRLIEFCTIELAGSQKEEFHGFFLNKCFELLHHECLQSGTLDHVTVYPRELLRHAIQHSASYIILAHNHPFGKASPSNADLAMTRQLAMLAEGLGITILDHLILAGNDCYSFLDNHQMPAMSPIMEHFVSRIRSTMSMGAFD